MYLNISTGYSVLWCKDVTLLSTCFSCVWIEEQHYKVNGKRRTKVRCPEHLFPIPPPRKKKCEDLAICKISGCVLFLFRFDVMNNPVGRE
jgi:hypothetical protein